MIIGVIGSRTFQNFKLMETELNKLEDVSKIVSGGAIGADSLAEVYARKYNIPTEIFKPNTQQYGKAGYFMRNRRIVDSFDIIVAFWNGTSRGTRYTLSYADQNNKPTIVIQF